MARFPSKVFALLLLANCSVIPARADLRDDGLNHLNAHRYQHAELCLRQAVRENPTDSSAHYYLANALVYLGKHKEAIAEYQSSFQLDPFGPVSGYCRRALMSYHADVPDSSVDPDTVRIATKASSNVRVYAPAPAPGVSSAIEKIRHDAEFEKYRHRQIADSMSDVARKVADQTTAQIQSAAHDEIDRIMNPPVVPGRIVNPQIYNPEYQKARCDEVRRNAEEAMQMARQKAEQKASNYKQWTQDRALVVDDTAANLENQLNARNLPGTPRLAATGTNLYVRNYSAPEQPSPYPDPHQGVVRIQRNFSGPQPGSNDSSGAAGAGDHATQQRFVPDSPDAHSVRGVVVKPEHK